MKKLSGWGREGVVAALSRLDGIVTKKKKNNNGTDGFCLWTATLDWFWKDKPQHCHVLFWLPDRKPQDLATWIN